MANRKNHDELDNVGFIGVAEKRSPAEVKADAKLTAAYIKRYSKSASTRPKSSPIDKAVIPSTSEKLKAAKVK